MEDIGRVYARHRTDYMRASTAILGDAESASDAVHEAFVNAIRARRRFRADGSLDGWIWAIVVNTAREHSRRVCHREPKLEPKLLADAGAWAGCDPDSTAERTALREQIAHLPERQRLILFLRFYADLDYTQIARILNISSGTVGAALHSALRALEPPERM